MHRQVLRMMPQDLAYLSSQDSHLHNDVNRSTREFSFSCETVCFCHPAPEALFVYSLLLGNQVCICKLDISLIEYHSYCSMEVCRSCKETPKGYIIQQITGKGEDSRDIQFDYVAGEE
ncbi:hypothetical protein PIB30_031453 [Stylosanthes scabra]|uniref:Uncharacterized protein n=1 Tax=Stylosanthes scabra TaxID=79078 RepID=A0ABU6SDE5_9FABA|nr:hypothetical protein [Stylosanthes scabra]